MVVKTVHIISSSYLIREGLRLSIHQLAGGFVIEDSCEWEEFFENFDKNIDNQVIIIDADIISKENKLALIKQVLDDNVLIILLYHKINEIKSLNDFESIPLNISKEELSEKLNNLLFNGEINKIENNVLSEREITILKEVALGLTNKEISDKLFISMHTVITHRKNITAKLGIKTISGLTVYAIINNIISPVDINK